MSGPNAQLTNLPQGSQFLAIEKFLQAERLGRYLAAAGGSKQKAFELYNWNGALCEAFHLPLHFAEVGCRNAIHASLVSACGPDWFRNKTFLGLLDDRFYDQLLAAYDKEAEQHKAALTAHHIVSALTLGFWEHLATKRFNRLLWLNGVQPFFAGAPKQANRAALHTLIESIRRWRNRIAHHRAIFDAGPSRKLADSIELVKWVCPATAAWVVSETRVQTVINARP